MLARTFRLSKRDIARLYKKGRSFKENSVLVRFMPNYAKNPRFAVVIPKSTLVKSTARSRLKRMVHISLKSSIPALKDNLDVMISIRKDIPEKEIKPLTDKIFSHLVVK